MLDDLEGDCADQPSNGFPAPLMDWVELPRGRI